VQDVSSVGQTAQGVGFIGAYPSDSISVGMLNGDRTGHVGKIDLFDGGQFQYSTGQNSGRTVGGNDVVLADADGGGMVIHGADRAAHAGAGHVAVSINGKGDVLCGGVAGGRIDLAESVGACGQLADESGAAVGYPGDGIGISDIAVDIYDDTGKIDAALGGELQLGAGQLHAGEEVLLGNGHGDDLVGHFKSGTAFGDVESHLSGFLIACGSFQLGQGVHTLGELRELNGGFVAAGPGDGGSALGNIGTAGDGDAFEAGAGNADELQLCAADGSACTGLVDGDVVVVDFGFYLGGQVVDHFHLSDLLAVNGELAVCADVEGNGSGDVVSHGRSELAESVIALGDAAESDLSAGGAQGDEVTLLRYDGAAGNRELAQIGVVGGGELQLCAGENAAALIELCQFDDDGLVYDGGSIGRSLIQLDSLIAGSGDISCGSTELSDDVIAVRQVAQNGGGFGGDPGHSVVGGNKAVGVGGGDLGEIGAGLAGQPELSAGDLLAGLVVLSDCDGAVLDDGCRTGLGYIYNSIVDDRSGIACGNDLFNGVTVVAALDVLELKVGEGVGPHTVIIGAVGLLFVIGCADLNGLDDLVVLQELDGNELRTGGAVVVPLLGDGQAGFAVGGFAVNVLTGVVGLMSLGGGGYVCSDDAAVETGVAVYGGIGSQNAAHPCAGEGELAGGGLRNAVVVLLVEVPEDVVVLFHRAFTVGDIVGGHVDVGEGDGIIGQTGGLHVENDSLACGALDGDHTIYKGVCLAGDIGGGPEACRSVHHIKIDDNGVLGVIAQVDGGAAPAEAETEAPVEQVGVLEHADGFVIDGGHVARAHGVLAVFLNLFGQPYQIALVHLGFFQFIGDVDERSAVHIFVIDVDGVQHLLAVAHHVGLAVGGELYLTGFFGYGVLLTEDENVGGGRGAPSGGVADIAELDGGCVVSGSRAELGSTGLTENLRTKMLDCDVAAGVSHAGEAVGKDVEVESGKAVSAGGG